MGGYNPRQEITTPSGMPPPTATLSLATNFRNLVFVAGQSSCNPNTGEGEGDIREQTRTALDKIRLILEEAGTSLDNILTATCFLEHREDFAAFNEEYAKYFPTDWPARALVVQAENPRRNQLVQIVVTACIPD